jgi:hypothetical protein
MNTRRLSRAKTVKLSFSLLACIATASGACAVQPGDGEGSTKAQATVPVAATSASNGSIPDPAKKPRRDIGPFDLIDDAKEIYNDYKSISGFLTPTVDTTAEILADLSSLTTQMQQINVDLNKLGAELAAVAYQDKQAAYIAQLELIQGYEAQAQTASEQLATWQQTGRTNALLLASADNNSQIAANALKESAYYYRPAQTAGAPDIFDARSALLAYLYALTVRLSIVRAENPNYRTLTAYQQEFFQHTTWLQQIPSLSQTDISCNTVNGTGPSLPVYASPQWQDPGSFFICSTCTDTNSESFSTINHWSPSLLNSGCTSTNPALAGVQSVENNYAAYFSFWDNYNMLDELAVHVVQAFTTQFEIDTTNPTSEISLAGLTYENVGPLVSNTGKCLTGGPEGGPNLTPCSVGSATQIWHTGYPVQGTHPAQPGPISLVTPPAGSPTSGTCIDTIGWDPSGFETLAACTGTLSEQYTVTSTNQLRWNYNPAYCLTDPEPSKSDPPSAVLALCNGGPAQQWGRAWPLVWIGPIGPIKRQ